jgi:hypothetical protein
LVWFALVSGAVLLPGLQGAADPVAGNLLANSSFEVLDEDGLPLGWQAANNPDAVLLDPTAAREGRLGVHLRLDGSETMLSQREYFRLEPGRPYTFSASVRTNALQPATGVSLQIINLGWSFGYQSALAITGGTADWQRLTRTFVCPAANAFPYQGRDNVEYLAVLYAKGVAGELWVDALQLEEGAVAAAYGPAAGDSAAAAVWPVGATEQPTSRSFRRAEYYEVQNPLFEELQGPEPGPGRVLYYGYEDLNVDDIQRPYARKFGLPYVLTTQRRELQQSGLIPMTNAWPRGGVGSYPTMRMILRPDEKGIAPGVFDGNPWIMDPRWQEAYVQKALALARQSLDRRPGNDWGNTWGLWAGDEVFESAGVMVVPADKRYPEVLDADREVRERFGSGRYGMPASPQDADPFRRIAYRRWVNARLAETYQRTYPLVKQVNRDLIMLGPDPCGGVPPVDIEAMTPYFDLISSQTWSSPRSHIDRLTTGADTKAMADLSECPVWSLVQHAATRTPEAIREQFSQVFRNGGQGLILLGVEWYDRELEHPQFISPAKWQALREVARLASSLRRLTLPRSDTAVLYASDTYLTFESPKMADGAHPQVYGAYAAIGPGVGSWFSFVSDRQIIRGTRDLANYRVLYVPLATYQSAAVLDKIEAYARQGGIVVCADETAFSWDITGDDLSGRWEKLTGVRRGPARPAVSPAKTVPNALLGDLREAPLRLPVPGVGLQPVDPSVELLAVFGDGTPAATVRPCGQGWLVCFAANPFASPDRNSTVTALVRAIQQAAGTKLDQPIWRFKLPPLTPLATEDAQGLQCLTDNEVVLDPEGGITPAHNVRCGGTYTYSRFPTGLADVATTGDIAFAEGHLTNRKAAFADRERGGGRHPPALEKWVVSWSDPEATSITLDLRQAATLGTVRLIYSGMLPSITVTGSPDGVQWAALGSKPARPVTVDVEEAVIPLAGAGRFLRLDFGARLPGMAMALSEVEVWGKQVGGP